MCERERERISYGLSMSLTCLGYFPVVARELLLWSWQASLHLQTKPWATPTECIQLNDLQIPVMNSKAKDCGTTNQLLGAIRVSVERL